MTLPSTIDDTLFMRAARRPIAPQAWQSEARPVSPCALRDRLSASVAVALERVVTSAGRAHIRARRRIG